MLSRARHARAYVGLVFAMILAGCISSQGLEDASPSVRYYAAVADYIQVKNLAVIHAESPSTSLATVKKIEVSVNEADAQLAVVEEMRQADLTTPDTYLAAAALLRGISAQLRTQIPLGELR